MLTQTKLLQSSHDVFTRWRGFFVTAILILLFAPLISVLPSVRLWLFCMPASYAASIFLGLQCMPAGEGYVLLHDSLPVYVTLACSASHYFVLVCALICGMLYDTDSKTSLRSLLWIVPMCYGVTLLANVARIVLCWYAGILARRYLAEGYWPSVHMGVGVLVFLSFLIVTYILIGRLYYVRRK